MTIAAASTTLPRSRSDICAAGALQDARECLDWLELRHQQPQHRTGTVGLHQAFLAFIDRVQPTRTNLQGCVCKGGKAMGGCCPAHAAAAGGACGSLGSGGWVLPGLGTILAGVGLVSGAWATRISWTGWRVVRAVDESMAGLERTLLLAYEPLPILGHGPLTKAAKAQELTAVRQYRQHLRISDHAQCFNFLVTGLLQMAAAGAAAVGAVSHLAGGLLGALGGAIGAAGGGLFGLYGVVLAARSFITYAQCRATALRQPDEHWSRGDCDDFNAAVRARGQHALRSGIAWSAVAASAVLGACIATGCIAVPAVTVGIIIGAWAAAAWAMWEGSQTRYMPHIPVGPHMDPAVLSEPALSAGLRHCLLGQKQAIDDANRTMLQALSPLHRAVHWLEQACMPQCGPSSFQFLPAAIQRNQDVPRAKIFEEAQRQGARHFVDYERALMDQQLVHRVADLEARYHEVHLYQAPRCPHKRLVSVAVYGAVTEELRQQARAAEALHEKIVALDLLNDELISLAEHVGELSAVHGMKTAAQTRWVMARLVLMQMQGTLANALPRGCDGLQFFRRLDGAVLPINNLHPAPTEFTKIARTMAPRLDGAFVHAFFAPSAIQGQLDFRTDQQGLPPLPADPSPWVGDTAGCCT